MNSQQLSISRIQHFLKQIETLKSNERAIKERVQFLEQELRKQKQRSQSLVEELQDMHNLNSKLQEHHHNESAKNNNRNDVMVREVRESLEDEMKERLKEKDILIKQIRINNEQSQDFLRKRIESYENQYKLLENNYAQLKDLFDDYQIKSQAEKSKWIQKKKDLETQILELKRQTKQDKYENLQQEYSTLLQKSAKSERRISKINNDIQDITRNYSKKLLNSKTIGRRPQDQFLMRKSVKSYDKLQCVPRQPFEPASSRYDSLQTSKYMHPQSTRRSPYKSYGTTTNKQNSSFFSNVNGITNFMEDTSHHKYQRAANIEIEVIVPAPSSDRVETHKKRFLDHLVINSERQSFKPHASMVEVETPCFEDKSKLLKKDMTKLRKINLKSKK